MNGWIGAERIAGELKAIGFAIKFIPNEPDRPIAARLISGLLMEWANPQVRA